MGDSHPTLHTSPPFKEKVSCTCIYKAVASAHTIEVCRDFDTRSDATHRKRGQARARSSPKAVRQPGLIACHSYGSHASARLPCTSCAPPNCAVAQSTVLHLASQSSVLYTLCRNECVCHQVPCAACTGADKQRGAWLCTNSAASCNGTCQTEMESCPSSQSTSKLVDTHVKQLSELLLRPSFHLILCHTRSRSDTTPHQPNADRNIPTAFSFVHSALQKSPIPALGGTFDRLFVNLGRKTLFACVCRSPLN